MIKKEIQKSNFNREVKMVKVVDDLVLEVGDRIDQMMVKGTPIKITKKLINIFIVKKKT